MDLVRGKSGRIRLFARFVIARDIQGNAQAWVLGDLCEKRLQTPDFLHGPQDANPMELLVLLVQCRADMRPDRFSTRNQSDEPALALL